MEAWTFFRYLICITPYFQSLQALQPPGYVGCFKDDIFRKVIWALKTDFINGARCIRTCRALGHIYAATQYHYCKCGMSIRGNPKQVSCQYKCPGYPNEICGGLNRMSVYYLRSAVHTTIRSTTPNSSMKITSEIASMSTEQVDLDTGRRTDDLVSVYISVPVLITVAVAISVAINVVNIFRLRRKRRKRRNSYRNRQRTTMGNSDDYLNASLPTNLPHHDYSYASIPNTHSDHRITNIDNNDLNESLPTNLPHHDYSYASIPNTHSDHRITNIDKNYLNESLQSNFLHPVAANTDSNYASGSSHSVCIVSSEEHEYVDINYEELLSQRKDNHCYSQLKT